MGQLKDIYPDYADRVHFVAVGVDPQEGAPVIRSYKQREGFTWPMTVADRDMLQDYRVTRQATFATVDADGIIASSVATGSMADDGWRGVFEGLIGS